MALDPLSILFMTMFALLVFLIAALVDLWFVRQRTMVWVPYAVALCGMVAIAFQRVLPPLVGVVLANLLLLASYPLFFTANALMYRIPIKRIRSVLVVGIFLIFLVYFTFGVPNTSARIVVFSLAAAALTGQYGFRFLRVRNRRRTPNAKLQAGLFFAAAVFHLFRAASTAAGGMSVHSFFEGDSGTIVLLTSVFLFVLVWNVVYYRTGKILAESRAQENLRTLRTLFDEIDVLHGFLQSEDQNKDLSGLYPRFFGILHEILGIRHVLLFRIDRENRRYVLEAQRGFDPGLVDLVRTMPFGNQGTTDTAVHEERLVSMTVDDYEGDEPTRQSLQRHGVSRLYSYPIRRAGMVIGAFTFAFTDNEDLPAAGERILKVLSAQLATAVGNVRRFTAISESESRYRGIFNLAANPIFIHRLNGTFVDVNQEAVERLGYSRDELLAMTPKDIDAPSSVDQYPDIIKRLTKEGSVSFEAEHVTKEGASIPVWITSTMISHEGMPAVLSIVKDLTERKKQEQELREATAKDPTTEYLSAAALEERMKEEMYRATRWQRNLGLVSLGFNAGSEAPEAIRKTAERLRALGDTSIVCARPAPNRFVFVLPEKDSKETKLFAETLRDELGDREIDGIGYANLEDGRQTSLLAAADRAREISRKMGRTRVVRA